MSKQKHRNEDGEPVSPIYDTKGFLTSISVNCDVLLSDDSLLGEKRTLIEGIKYMVSELILRRK